MSIESVEDFRLRARQWLKENLPPDTAGGRGYNDDDQWPRARDLQRILHDGGFAGLCYPKEYGGQGLTLAHQRVFTEEAAGYEMPLALNVPTLSICAPTILDIGSEEQKREHLPRVIRGEELLVQFLSEPRGGSDLAGLTTRADKDGDTWILNGSKIWSSGAYAADYGLCLARTDWSVPKHQGLTMFLVPVNSPGVTIQRIKQVNDSDEFCQEFFDDVRLPAEAVLGEVNGGWATASRMLFHERSAMGGGSPYTSGARSWIAGDALDLVRLAQRIDVLEDPRVREEIAQARIMKLVQEQLVVRVTDAMRAGSMPATGSSIIRLFRAESDNAQTDAAMRIAGATGVTGEPEGVHGLGHAGWDYLYRQSSSIAGGSVEMSRNVISERLLGMPREQTTDRDIPFDQVKHGR